ncbi:glycosyltransferase [Natronorubrum bangense]|nr:glycosyltransferase family A protein [Natronorubrum bangense]
MDAKTNETMREATDPYVVVDPTPESLTADVVNPDELPAVSVCIPTYNSEETIERCLQSITKQEYSDVEIVVIDGGSNDQTTAIAQRFADEVVIDTGPLGSARQTGLERSSGELVALFDSDIYLPASGWLRRAVKYFNYDEQVSTVWPVLVPPPSSSPISKAYARHFNLILEDRIRNEVGLLGLGNALFRRDVFEEVGGIDRSVHWGEDIDWARKFRDSGYQVVYLDDPIYHDTMKTLSEFARAQREGAKSFATGEGFMDFPMTRLLYEQFGLGAKGFVRGMARGDTGWAALPALLSVRALVYGFYFGRNQLQRPVNQFSGG